MTADLDVSARSTGCIRWPELGSFWSDGGEGGMWVYAFWPTNSAATREDPFIRCHGPAATINLTRPDFIVKDAGEIYDPPRAPRVVPADFDPESGQYMLDVLDAGLPVLAAVCLGTTEITFMHEGQYWFATDADLTQEGLDVVGALNLLYERSFRLVTYLDT